MRLYSGIIDLDYDPTIDVLFTRMPDARLFGLSEVSFCLDQIVESIRNYYITNLLLDASNSKIEVNRAAYKAVTTKFSMDLISTRLKKLARVGTLDEQRKKTTLVLSTEIKQELNFEIQFRTFSTQDQALAWLTQTGEFIEPT